MHRARTAEGALEADKLEASHFPAQMDPWIWISCFTRSGTFRKPFPPRVRPTYFRTKLMPAGPELRVLVSSGDLSSDCTLLMTGYNARKAIVRY